MLGPPEQPRLALSSSHRRLGLKHSQRHVRDTCQRPSLLCRPARRFVVGSPGEPRGRAWENMGEIEPAKRNEKHISGCEGKRMQRHNPKLQCFRHLRQKGESDLLPAHPRPKPRGLREMPEGFSVRTFAGTVTVTKSLPCGCDMEFPQGGFQDGPGTQLVCTLGMRVGWEAVVR